MLQETVAVNVGQFCEGILDVGAKLRMKELEDIGGLNVTHYDRRVDVVGTSRCLPHHSNASRERPTEASRSVVRWSGTSSPPRGKKAIAARAPFNEREICAQ